MLKHRVIPIVLIDGFSVLKTINFDTRRNLGNPITVARIYNTRNVDELVLLDIDASKQNRSIDLFTIRSIADECFMPLSVGGGIRTLSDIQKCLENGADKVIINTSALKDPDFIKSSSKSFGSQCITVSVDVTKKDGQYCIYSHSIAETKIDLQQHLQLIQNNGAGEIMINDVDCDGKMEGVNEGLIEAVSKSITEIPIIYCGGVSSPQDCSQVIKSGASAVAASSIFHFTRYTPSDCRNQMREDGIPTRL